jgi:hypothetical protein
LAASSLIGVAFVVCRIVQQVSPCLLGLAGGESGMGMEMTTTPWRSTGTMIA